MGKIVKDSSIWISKSDYAVCNDRDMSIRIGIVKERMILGEDDSPDAELKYVVEVFDGNVFPVICSTTTRFGGIYNYEEYLHRGCTSTGTREMGGEYSVRSGDMVIVAFVRGDPRDGVILGCLKHRGRKEVLQDIRTTLNVAYRSEFNGIETIMDVNGQFKQTFKGQPTNLPKLEEANSGQEIPDAEYDYAKGGSYYSWLKDGSYVLSDNSGTTAYVSMYDDKDPYKESTDDVTQFLKIDKPNGKIIVKSGKTILTIDKAQESYSVVNKVTDIKSTKSFTLNTVETIIKSTNLFDLESASIKTKGSWQQQGPVNIKGDVTHTGKYTQTGNHIVNGSATISGGLVASGSCSLAGGAHPLIYEIQTIIGVGNLGLPVVSHAIVLKTSKTLAS